MKIKCVWMILIMLSTPLLSWACGFNEEFESLARKIKESRQILTQESLENIDVIKQHLTTMVNVDQCARALLINNIDDTNVQKLMEEIDRFHTTHLKAILNIHQWITISKFGKDADHQAWLLVQHADHDPEFQASCLSTLEKLFPLKETEGKNYAYLYDRVALRQGQKQRYGTQAKIEGNKIELLPFEGSVSDLNKRRQEMELCHIEEYLETLKMVYKI